MIFQIKKWFYSYKLKLTEKKNQTKQKKYEQALELEALTKKTKIAQKEVNKKKNLIDKHSWAKKATEGLHTLQKHLPKVDSINSREPKSSKDFGKDFFSNAPKL